MSLCMRAGEDKDLSTISSRYPFTTTSSLDKAGSHRRTSSMIVQGRARGDSAIAVRSTTLSIERLHRRHESHANAIPSRQIPDSQSTPGLNPHLPKKGSGSMYQHKGAGFIPQSPSIRMSSMQSLSGSKEDVWGTYRHTLQFSLAGISASRDDKSHKRHSSLISRQRFLRSSDRLLSPSSLLDMQSLLPPPAVSSHTRIPVLDNHEEFTTEKYTPLLGTNSSSSQSTRRSLAFWLILYFCFNLGLTLYNKGILIHFPFPYTLTALHAFCGTIGGLILLKNGTFVPAELTTADNLALVAFSVLYTINIAVSNISLHLVTVPVSDGILCVR